MHYLVEIKDPKNHLVTVTMNLKKTADHLTVFIPSWSPGSYLMREYGRHIKSFKPLTSNGEFLYYEQIDKGAYQVDFTKSQLNKDVKNGDEFSIQYDIFCHELTVRTSHVDESHAFLHGPSYLMGVDGESLENPTIEFKFPALWSKVATGLKDISKDRQKFIYEAANYDVLIDAPVEIGCHESDGFIHDGKPHHINFYGPMLAHGNNLKKDIQTIVETVANTWGEIPYDQYVFITHLAPNLYGGLEHLNSTALQFDGTRFANREDYLNWLELVSHEYFHTWNVKRIRPKELGPFDYRNENYTRMHWLTEGLTSFMDRFLVLRSGLMTQQEYLEKMLKDITRYLNIPGRKFHSLEESSYNAWVKLYRADENHNNSSVSYYLKGGIVFFCLHCMLVAKGKSTDELLQKLWQRYKSNPDVGVEDHEVYQMIEDIAGKDVRAKFETYVTTTEEIDFHTHFDEVGLEMTLDEDVKPSLGLNPRFEGDRVFIASVIQDQSAYKSGLNAGDEILAIDGVRFLKKQYEDFAKIAKPGHTYGLVLSRNGNVIKGDLLCEEGPRLPKKLEATDKLNPSLFK